MAEFEFSRFLEPVSAEAPCGDNLEYAPLLQEIERAVEDVPERTVGSSVLPAKEPEWRSVRKNSLLAMEQTRDIQVAVYLTRALLHIDGFEGASQGLQLIHGLLDLYWDCVYPLQDEDDTYPVLRMNTLSTLANREAFLDPLRNKPLTDSQVMGRYSLRDVETAKRRQDTHAKDDNDLPKLSQIEAAFMDTDLDALTGYASAASKSLTEVQAIVTLTQNRVGAVDAPDFSALLSLLKELQQTLAAEIHKRGGQSDDIPGETNGTEPAGEGPDSTSKSLSNGINSRQEVEIALDAILDYFARYDPSSPIPFMLKRARRLLYKDFKQILVDLAPDGLVQAENIFGVDETE